MSVWCRLITTLFLTPVNSMTKYLPTLAFALFLFSTHLAADTITVTDTIDFEGSNDAMNIDDFSDTNDGSSVTIEFDQNVMSNGSEVAELMITNVVQKNNNSPPGFAGVVIGEFDLAINPQVSVGNITVSDLDEFTFSFDTAVVTGANPTGLRIEPLGGGFDQRIDLNIFPNGGFQNYAVDLGTLDTAQSNLLVTSLNDQGITQIQFVLGFGTPFEVGNTVLLDNLTLSTVVAVPEPSAAFMFLLVSLHCLGRRRRA